MDSSVSQLPVLPQLLFLVVAVATALIAASVYWWRHRPSAVAPVHPAARPAQITYRQAPTSRMLDSQRVDRVRKVVRLAAGEQIELADTRPGQPSRLRIQVKRVVACEGCDVAHIAVDFGGTAVSCGPLVEEIAFNEYALARASRDEPRNCVYHYEENGDALDFMRIKLSAIEAAAGWAELDVMQVSGHWPAES